MKEVARSNPLNTCEIMDGYIIYLNKDYSCLGIHCLGQQQAIIASLFKLEIHKCPIFFQQGWHRKRSCMFQKKIYSMGTLFDVLTTA